jgi:hypothetical protein
MKQRLSVLLLVIASVGGLSARAAPPAPVMALKEASNGEAFRRVIPSSTRIPINRKYEELTAEQKQVLNDAYENVAPGDEPPFPLHGLKAIMEKLAKAQSRLRVEGELTLIVSVSPEGEATEVAAYGAPHPEMAQFAASLLLLTKFKPAMCSQRPCAMQYPFHAKFTLY